MKTYIWQITSLCEAPLHMLLGQVHQLNNISAHGQHTHTHKNPCYHNAINLRVFFSNLTFSLYSLVIGVQS